MAQAKIAEKHGTTTPQSQSKFFASLQRLVGKRSTSAERQTPSLSQQNKVEPIVASEEGSLPQYNLRQEPNIDKETPSVPTTEELNEDYVEYRNNHAVMSYAATTIAISVTFFVGWSPFVATNGVRGHWVEQLFQVSTLWYVLGFLFEVILVRMEHWRGLPIGTLPCVLEATTWYFGSYFPVMYLVVYLGAHELYGLVPEQQ
ncbi:hypothetical protein HDU96_010368 [Phlyctochytrium bullatum]|nr:hypothetical protein HDU96_010368 [Phlyctochytrium bullatum]